ncbi:MAG: DUF2589 domain-containing protein [Firmicutes bacterium]|nr:DUF2589 domain-containing protein [[Eubacterium] siraeum]MCM1488391.1 DUF2589 domain-containing protein [Bacillota bacterium]
MDIRQLIDAIGAAVHDAHKAIAQSSAEFYFGNYFDQDEDGGAYIPKMVEIKLPTAEGERIIAAPLATLVNQGCLNIDSLKLNLNIEALDQGQEDCCFSVSPAGAEQSGSKTGEIEILFKCNETSEGASRVETHLNSLL